VIAEDRIVIDVNELGYVGGMLMTIAVVAVAWVLLRGITVRIIRKDEPRPEDEE
jgi:hypothetical protein